MISITTDLTNLMLKSILKDSTLSLNKAINELSSGYKINHASDNAANYSIIDNLNTKIGSLLQVQNNANDGINLLSTAQGTLEEMLSGFESLRDLAIQASNETYGQQSRDALQSQANNIIAEIQRTQANTTFGDIKLFNTDIKFKQSPDAIQTQNFTTRGLNALANNVINNKSHPASAANAADAFLSTNSTDLSASEDAIDTSAFTPFTPSATSLSMMARAPAEQSDNTITGAEDFAGGATKTITIDGVEYTIKNKLTTQQTVSYSKDTDTGVLTFYCSNFEIRSQSDVAHNLVISGGYNVVYGGELDDTISNVSNKGRSTTIYGLGGNDNLTVYNTTDRLYGGDGDDILNLYGYATAYGEDGDDIFNSFASATLYGGLGNDTFNLKSSSTNAYGNEDDDIFNIFAGAQNNLVDGGIGNNQITDNGTNTTKINVPGANTFQVSFNSKETKTLTINNIDYTVTNTGTGTRDFNYSITDDGCIIFKSSNFTIKGDLNKAHNVKLNAAYLWFYGGNLADTISINLGYCYVDAKGGNDTINNTGNLNHIYGGDGDDIIYNNASIWGDFISGGNGNDKITILNGSAYNYILTDDGDDEVNINSGNNFVYNSSGTINVNTTSNENKFYGCGELDNSKIFLLNSNETKTINIAGKNYTIKSSAYSQAPIFYDVNEVSGLISLAGYKMNITAQNDVEHNVTIGGYNVTFKGGDLNDNIVNSGYCCSIYGGAGDDNIVNNGNQTYIYGEKGNDTITINNTIINVEGGEGDDTFINNLTNSGMKGGVGNDIYILNKSANVTDTGGNNIYHVNCDGANISGSPNDDTFYIRGNNNTVLGAGGGDYFVVDGQNNLIDGGTGTNFYVDNSGGTTTINNAIADPNSGMIFFDSVDEVKIVTIGGKEYIITNQNADGTSPASNSLKFYFNPNTNVITFDGSNLTIKSADNQKNLLEIRGSNNTIYGSDLVDNIKIDSGTNNTVHGLGGNDVLTSNTADNSLIGGDGDDTISVNATTSKLIDGGAGNDNISINADNCTNVVAGSGSDSVEIVGASNKVDLGNGNNTLKTTGGGGNEITASDGNNRFVIQSKDNVITSGNGSNTVGIDSTGNVINLGNGINNVNMYGANNTINAGDGKSKIKVEGSSNKYVGGAKDIVVKGDSHVLELDGGDMKAEITGNSNNISSNFVGEQTYEINGNGNTIEGGAKNTVSIIGDNNTFLSGDDGSTVTIKGDSNKFVGGAANDTVRLKSGDSNILDGGGGRKNLLINKGTNTQSVNFLEYQSEPFKDFDIKVGIGGGEGKTIRATFGFDMFMFEVDFSTAESARESLEEIDEKIKELNEQLVNIGASMNRIMYAQEEQSTVLENLLSTRSTLRDADVAKVSSELIRNQILQQASATLMSTSRNLRHENVIGLLQGLRR